MFLDESNTFFKAARKLHLEREDILNYIIPVYYLYRHSLELVLKSVILLAVNQYQQEISNLKNLFVNREINLIEHSISKLFECLLSLRPLDSLSVLFSSKELSLIIKTIDYIDSIDTKGDFARYPIRTNLDITHDPIVFEVSEMNPETVSDLTKGENVYLGFDGSGNYKTFVLYNYEMVDEFENIANTIILLSDMIDRNNYGS